MKTHWTKQRSPNVYTYKSVEWGLEVKVFEIFRGKWEWLTCSPVQKYKAESFHTSLPNESLIFFFPSFSRTDSIISSKMWRFSVWLHHIIKIFEFSLGPYTWQRIISIFLMHGGRKGRREAGCTLTFTGRFPCLDKQRREKISCFTGSYWFPGHVWYLSVDRLNGCR